jgi:hypothetical protein
VLRITHYSPPAAHYRVEPAGPIAGPGRFRSPSVGGVFGLLVAELGELVGALFEALVDLIDLFSGDGPSLSSSLQAAGDSGLKATRPMATFLRMSTSLSLVWVCE